MWRDDDRGYSQSLKFSVTPDYFRAAARPAGTGIRFGREELRQILISVSVLTVAFAVALSGGIYSLRDATAFGITLFAALIAVSTAFLLHELAHKVLAQRYGCFAEYRMSPKGLLLAVLTSMFGFLFALPGAVVISGYINNEQNGRISLAGPVTNMAVGAVFLSLLLIDMPETLATVIRIVAFINLFLAVFNLLPIPPMDGSKVYRWNGGAYIAVMALAVALLVIAWW